MPTTASVSSDLLLTRLSSPAPDIKLKALREVKNRIIGNPTKKLAFLNLGTIPAIASVLAQSSLSADADVSSSESSSESSNIIIQSAAALGSFACGFDAGAHAVLDSGSFPHLLRLLSHPDGKVVDAGARALRMIYQSKLGPKFGFLEEKNMEFLVSLLNSESENVTGLGASIVTHSCESNAEQKVLYEAGVLKRLVSLLNGSLNERNASLESLAAVFRNNPEIILKFLGPEAVKNDYEIGLKLGVGEGRIALSSMIELTKDRYPKTRLLACICLIVIRNSSDEHLQDIGMKTKLVRLLLELLDDPSQVGDEASFAFSSLIAEKEDLQKLAFEANAVGKLCNHLQKGGQVNPKRLQGVLLALADLCSKLESCRSTLLSMKVLNSVVEALTHDIADVRSAACICLRSITRSIKSLCAGHFMKETLVIPLVRLLDDHSVSVQVAALSAISNIAVDFTMRKSAFMQCGGVKQLVQLSKSMDPTVRLNALWALRNMMFLADVRCKEEIFLELTAPLLASLICDSEPSVQEQALALVQNLVDGCVSLVEYVFAEDAIILNAVGRQLQSALKAEIGIQGMYVLGNVASGNEVHKEAVMHQLLPQADNRTKSFMTNFLQSNDNRLRIAALWTVVNLTFPSYPGAFSRLGRLQNVGILSQIKNMANDPCLDVKLRARMVLTQSMTFDHSLALAPKAMIVEDAV